MPLNSAEAQLAVSMSGFWIEFAKSGAPAAEAVWPHFHRAANDTTLQIQTPAEGGIRSMHSVRQRACDWADAHPVSGPVALGWRGAKLVLP